LPGKALDVTVGKWNKAVALEEVEQAKIQEVCDDADMTSEIEAVSQVDASVPVLSIVLSQGLQGSEFDLGCVSIFLHRSDHLDSDELIRTPIHRLHYLSKGSLA
jgi:hypothetical protein